MAGDAGRDPEPREGEEGPASAGVMMVVGFIAAQCSLHHGGLERAESPLGTARRGRQGSKETP
jgi:hypothetical protein